MSVNYTEGSFIRRLSLDDASVSEAKKSGDVYLRNTMDYLIAHLVFERERISKCRDLYDGNREEREFQYLKDQYGVVGGELKMTPIVKPRINALLGNMLDQSKRYLVTANDTETIDLIQQEKKEKHLKDVERLIKMQLQEDSASLEQGEPSKSSYINKNTLKKVQRKYSEDFKSDFEKAAHHLVSFFENDNDIALKRHAESLFEDLLVTGESYYRVYSPEVGMDPIVEVVKPENIFFNINTNDETLNNCDAVVRREYMTRRQILTKWGHYMTKDDIDELFRGSSQVLSGTRWYSTRIIHEKPIAPDTDLRRQFTFDDEDVLEAFHIEWIANNKVEVEDPDGAITTDAGVKKYRWRQDRYEGVRIGTHLYLNMGKSRHVERTNQNPYRVKLTYNGYRFKGRSGEVHSLAWSLKDVQDQYDLAIFYRDALLAASGVDSTRVNIAAIPKVLGEEFMERLLKFLELRKTAGVELVDASQEDANLFQHYGSSSNSVDANLIQAIEVVLASIEKQADVIAGTNPQMLGMIEQRDAVSNVKAGIQQTALINKSLFESHSRIMVDILTKLVESAKTSYQKGKKGAYIIGSYNFAFDINPDHYTNSDFNIHILDSQKELVKLEKLNALVTEMATAGIVPPEVLFTVAMSDSVTDIMSKIMDSIGDSEEEGGQAQEAQGQAEEMQQQLQELSKALEQSQKELEKLGGQDAQLKAEELKVKIHETNENISNNKKKLELEEQKILEELALKRETVQLERDQLYLAGSAGQGNAAEVKNI